MSFGKMSFLMQYDKAPESEKFPLVRAWLDDTPLPFFEELRKERPILVTPACTLVAGFHDVVDVLLQPSIFTVDLYYPKMGDYMLAQDDTPVHFREKAIMQSMLNRDDLPAIRQLIGRRSKETLDKADNAIEYINGYCRLIPALLVQEYFGLDGIDSRQLIEWSYWSQYDTFHNQPFDIVKNADGIHDKAVQASQEMRVYLGELIQRKLREIQAGGDSADVVSRMLKTQYPESVGFPIDRLGRNIGGLLIGAVETTSQAVAQILQVLLRNKKAFTMALATINDDSSFDRVVWEALRFNPISPYLFRKSAAEYTLGRGKQWEHLIPAGTHVLPLILSAMFDEEIFENPKDFKANRPWADTFHFGFGLHECLGKYIGMVMIPEMVRQTLKRPNLTAQSAIDYKGGPFPEQYMLSWG